MWDLPGPGLEPVSPALAGGFSTTAPPGKSIHGDILMMHFYANQIHILRNYETFFFQGDLKLNFFITNCGKLITDKGEDSNLYHVLSVEYVLDSVSLIKG